MPAQRSDQRGGGGYHRDRKLCGFPSGFHGAQVCTFVGILSIVEGSAPSVPLRDYVDVRCDNLERRLDESATDRERIREAVGNRVNSETFQLLVDRVGSLERQNSRLYGALGIIAILGTVLGFAVRYLFG